MFRLIIFLLLIYIAYLFARTLIRYKKRIKELEREVRKRKIDEMPDTDYEEIED